nr:unnamed protein product [Callosobruchus analis]CAI5832278.1 unnamed protein product [Callosobruchus analis]
MSDTHSLIRNIMFDIPDGDVFIHAGDFTKCGQKEEVIQFDKWLDSLPHKHKIVIAGNHELSFDQKFSEYFKKLMTAREAVNTQNIRQYLTNCTYLEDSGIELYGIKIYGSPWQPEYNNWAFNLKRGAECLSKWNKIPDDTEILITHTPPLGHGDLACSGVRAGCVELLNTVQKRVKPKYHVFGHIHEGMYIGSHSCEIHP